MILNSKTLRAVQNVVKALNEGNIEANLKKLESKIAELDGKMETLALASKELKDKDEAVAAHRDEARELMADAEALRNRNENIEDELKKRKAEIDSETEYNTKWSAELTTEEAEFIKRRDEFEREYKARLETLEKAEASMKLREAKVAKVEAVLAEAS